MDFKNFIFVLVGLISLSKYGDTVRLTIQPNPLTVGGSDVTNPITSPQEVVFECTPEGTGSISGVYSLYLKRANIVFAEITNFDTNAKLTDNAPSDIRTKNPTLEGSINLNNPSSSVLRARFLRSRMSCLDEEMFYCEMLYKPMSGDNLKDEDDERLVINFLAGPYEITASRYVNQYPMQVMNQSSVEYNDNIEYTCTGSIGKTSSTLINWYMYDHTSGLFGTFMPNGNGESIDSGQPSVTVCPYSRTSTLRYMVTTADRNHLVFRCGVSTQTSTGALHTAYSLDFTLSPPVTDGRINGATSLFPVYTVLVMLINIVMSTLTFS